MEVTILSLFSNRPDFVKPQYESAKKHLKDDFYYVVVNNVTLFGKEEEIEKIAFEEKTGYVCVCHDARKRDASVVVRDTLNFLWKDFKNTKGILAIMDSDLFFTKDVSFNELLDGYDMAFCPLYNAGKVFPWTGFMLFNMDKIKAEDINFSFYALDKKVYSDVGSGIHAYIEKHNPKINFIDRKEILDEPNELLKDFPHPYSVDILPFMFHYKTSSNYAPHCTPEYNRQKTEAMMKIL